MAYFGLPSDLTIAKAVVRDTNSNKKSAPVAQTVSLRPRILWPEPVYLAPQRLFVFLVLNPS